MGGGARQERGVYAAEAWGTKSAFGLSGASVPRGRLCGLKPALRSGRAVFVRDSENTRVQH